MLRAILADSDPSALEHLKNLVDYRVEGLDVIGTAESGAGLLDQIKSLHPDLVILDTNLQGEVDWIRQKGQEDQNTHYSGMDIVEHYRPFRHYVRFIVTSADDDYKTLKRALRCEVLDYLKKPVSREDLKAALHLAIEHSISRQIMESAMPVISGFREDSYQSGALQIPDTEENYTESILETCNLDFATEFGVGICIGLRPEVSEELSKVNYQKFTILTLAIYSRILTFFRENNI